MAWFHQSKNVVRGAVLILLLVAIVGPWAYSSDGAPPAEWCRDPNILLENERCVRHVLFRGQKHAEKVDSGFRGNFPAFYRESRAKSRIDFLEMNRAK